MAFRAARLRSPTAALWFSIRLSWRPRSRERARLPKALSRRRQPGLLQHPAANRNRRSGGAVGVLARRPVRAGRFLRGVALTGKLGQRLGRQAVSSDALDRRQFPGDHADHRDRVGHHPRIDHRSMARQLPRRAAGRFDRLDRRRVTINGWLTARAGAISITTISVTIGPTALLFLKL